MYKFIWFISVLLRQFVIPNPFDALGDGIPITINGISIIIAPIIINLAVEPIMHFITYSVVGLHYSRGSNPAMGSFLYLLFYCVHTFALWLLSLAGFATWAIVVVLIGYILFHIVFSILREQIGRVVQ